MAFFNFSGRIHHLIKHAIDPVTNPEGLIVGLKMDIAGPSFDGVHEDQIGQFDHRGFRGGQFQIQFILVLFGLNDIHFQVSDVFQDIGDGIADGVKFVEGLLEALIGHQKKLDVASG